MARGKKGAQGLTPEEKLAQALVPMEEQPYQIPENWCWVRLLNVANLYNGDRGKNYPSKKDYQITGIPFINAGALVDGQLEPKEFNYISEEKYNALSAGKIQCGDILYCLRGSLGKSAIVEIEGNGAISSSLCILRCTKAIDNRFLFFLLNSDIIKKQQDSAENGSAQPNLSAASVIKYMVPLPSILEQQRIVDRIESIFAKLDEAKEKAQAVVDGFDLRKSAILHKAVTGELTEKWRETEAIKNQWEIKKFRNFCLLKRGYDLPASQRIKGVYPLVSSSGVIDAHCEYKVKGPGVITGRSGTIGKVFIVNEDYWPLNTTLYSENLFGNDPFYVYYYLQTFDFKTYSSSTAVPTLNRNMFLDVEVSVPTLKEQAEIVRILDKLLAKENAAKEAAESVLDQIDTMKKAVLARAFRGELGTNDPAEESAVELLQSGL